MVIDVFCHIIPPRYLTALENTAAAGKIPPLSDVFLMELQVPAISDVAARFKLMDNYPEVREVLTITGPFLEAMAKPEDAVTLAKLVNDEIAELVAKYPDRFAAGVAFLPYNDMEATLGEIDRTIKELKLRGIEIGTDVNGKPLDSPEFMPIYEKMERYNLPIFIHPSKNSFAPDYPGETPKYNLFGTLGWPHSTSMAMMRLVHSGVLEKYPGLKFITHHAGGTVPYLAKRIELGDPHQLPKSLLDYLRLFYNDTAVQGNIPNLMCAHAFFGADHLLFGTDFPFGDNQIVAVTLRSVEEMSIPSNEKKKILEDNARKLLLL
jgi:aminocarboxymuconate-semialdehyde decarboxylase